MLHFTKRRLGVSRSLGSCAPKAHGTPQNYTRRFDFRTEGVENVRAAAGQQRSFCLLAEGSFRVQGLGSDPSSRNPINPCILRRAVGEASLKRFLLRNPETLKQIPETPEAGGPDHGRYV